MLSGPEREHPATNSAEAATAHHSIRSLHTGRTRIVFATPDRSNPARIASTSRAPRATRLRPQRAPRPLRDLARASSTAEIIAEAAGCPPVIIDPGWRERTVGSWQGLTTAQIEGRYPGALAASDYPPGWESNESLLDRVFAAIHRAAARVPSGDVLVVSHAGVIYTLEQHFGCDFERIGNLGGRRLLVEAGQVRLQERIALTGDGACLRPAATKERR